MKRLNKKLSEIKVGPRNVKIELSNVKSYGKLAETYGGYSKSYADWFITQVNLEDKEIFATTAKQLKEIFLKLVTYKGGATINIPGGFLSLMPHLISLPITGLIDVLGMSKSTYYRVRSEERLEMDTVDRISSLFKIYLRGFEAFEGDMEDFKDWLNTRIPTLGDNKPLELLKTENGRFAVLDAIDRIEHNVYG